MQKSFADEVKQEMSRKANLNSASQKNPSTDKNQIEDYNSHESDSQNRVLNDNTN